LDVGASNLCGMDLRIGIEVYKNKKKETQNSEKALHSLIYSLMEDDKVVDKLLAKRIAGWLVLEVESIEKHSIEQQPIHPMMRFKKYLAEASITRPDEKVLRLIVAHFSNRASFVYDVESALNLYEFVKKIPSSSTYSAIEETAQVKLKSPYETESSSVMITGADSDGCPILVKVLQGDKSINSETGAVDTLKLENPREALVPSKVCRIQVKGRQWIIMPLYPSTLLKMAHLLPLNVIHREGMKIRQALNFIHEQNLVHMDVKPANIFVSSNGNWVLGDYGACVKIGEAIHSTTQAFFPENVLSTPARTGFDSFMLCVSLVLLVRDFDEISQHNMLRINEKKLLKEIEAIEFVPLKNMLLELYEEYKT